MTIRGGPTPNGENHLKFWLFDYLPYWGQGIIGARFHFMRDFELGARLFTYGGILLTLGGVIINNKKEVVTEA